MSYDVKLTQGSWCVEFGQHVKSAFVGYRARASNAAEIFVCYAGKVIFKDTVKSFWYSLRFELVCLVSNAII